LNVGNERRTSRARRVRGHAERYCDTTGAASTTAAHAAFAAHAAGACRAARAAAAGTVAVVIAATGYCHSEGHHCGQHKTDPKALVFSHDFLTLISARHRFDQFPHFDARINGLSLKNAFNRVEAALPSSRKICASKRIIRLSFASSAGITSKPFS
jgi:hypothetical protein